MSTMVRALAAGLALMGAATLTHAAAFSFGGTFAQDDDLRVMNFSTTDNGDVTIETFGFAGGTDPTGKVVAAGGFDPVFGLFDAGGALLAVGDDGATRIDNQDPGAAFDALWTGTLAKGSYFVVLAQYDSYPIGPTYADGFLESGNGNFTAAFGCAAGKFCDLNGYSRTGDYDLAISGVAVAVPEPATATLMLLALAALTGAARWPRRRRR